MALELDALDTTHIVADALALVDTHFKAITSLQEIIVEVYEDGPKCCSKEGYGESQMDNKRNKTSGRVGIRQAQSSKSTY